MAEGEHWTMFGWNVSGGRLSKRRFISETTLMGLTPIEASRSILVFTMKSVCIHRLVTSHLGRFTGSEKLGAKEHRLVLHKLVGGAAPRPPLLPNGWTWGGIFLSFHEEGMNIARQLRFVLENKSVRQPTGLGKESRGLTPPAPPFLRNGEEEVF